MTCFSRWARTLTMLLPLCLGAPTLGAQLAPRPASKPAARVPVKPPAPRLPMSRPQRAQATAVPVAARPAFPPIVITRGGVYRGHWQSFDARTPAVMIRTSQPVVIEDSLIESRGPLIFSAFARARVTVRNNRGVALSPDRPLKEHAYPGRFLHLEEFSSAVVENNDLTGTSGMYFRDFRGDAARGESVRVNRNRALNIDGRYSTGVGTFSDSEARTVQFVQFNRLRDLVGAEIGWNEVINQPGRSRPEEVVSMYESSGTAASPIQIHDNFLQGAYAARPTTSAYSGGGMNLGDGNGRTLAEATGFIDAYRNVVVNTGNQGIAVSAGHDIRVYHNRVLSSGYLQDGRPIAAQNVGMYVWDFNHGRPYGTFYNISVHDNLVGWSTPLNGRDTTNPWWFPDCPASWPLPGGGTLPGCAGNRTLPGRVTQTMELQEYELWKARTLSANVKVGPPA